MLVSKRVRVVGWRVQARLVACLISAGCGADETLAAPVDEGPNGSEPWRPALPSYRADCNRDPSDGDEVDLRNDAANCGACGHDCRGGGCSAALCEPVLVAATTTDAWGLVSDATRLYWTDCTAGLVLSALLDGGDPVVLAAGEPVPLGIAVDASNVYWTNAGSYSPCTGEDCAPLYNGDGSVRRAPRLGGAAATLASGQQLPTDVVVSGGRLYFIAAMAGAVMVIALDGTPPEKFASLYVAGAGLLSGADPHGLAIDSSYLYWATLGGIFRAPVVHGSAAAIVWTDWMAPAAFAVDSDSFYFVTEAGVLASMPKSAGAPTPLAAEEADATGLVADATYVYWIGDATDPSVFAGRSILRVPKRGGQPQRVAPAGGARRLAIAGSSVYWIDPGAGGGGVGGGWGGGVDAGTHGGVMRLER